MPKVRMLAPTAGAARFGIVQVARARPGGKVRGLSQTRQAVRTIPSRRLSLLGHDPRSWHSHVCTDRTVRDIHRKVIACALGRVHSKSRRVPFEALVWLQVLEISRRLLNYFPLNLKNERLLRRKTPLG